MAEEWWHYTALCDTHGGYIRHTRYWSIALSWYDHPSHVYHVQWLSCCWECATAWMASPGGSVLPYMASLGGFRSIAPWFYQQNPLCLVAFHHIPRSLDILKTLAFGFGAFLLVLLATVSHSIWVPFHAQIAARLKSKIIYLDQNPPPPHTLWGQPIPAMSPNISPIG